MPTPPSSLSRFVDAVTDTEAPDDVLSARQSIKLLQALSAVPDPRRRWGRRHSLQSILMVAVCAVLAGARTYAAIGDWAAAARPAVGVCGTPASAATFRRVIMTLDPVAVQAALTTWALSCLAEVTLADLASAACPRNASRQVLAVDGKSLRGARGLDGTRVKLLGVIDHRRGLVLTQTEVVEGNEIAAFVTGLNTLPYLRGWLVTADALHTQRSHADHLLARGAHYPLTKQPSDIGVSSW